MDLVVDGTETVNAKPAIKVMIIRSYYNKVN